jgi:hypothetical protein
MTPRQFACLAAGFVITLTLTACSSSHPYPESWPKTVKGELVGECPSIAGRYWDLGVTEPAEAPVHTLAELLGLGDADYVVIDQTPDTVSVSAWLSDTCVETASFSRLLVTSENAWEDLDLSVPQWFVCPMALLSGRQFSFPHLSGAQVWGFGVEFSSVSKTADGSLVIMLYSGGEVVWYKFKPVEKSRKSG